MNIDEILHFWFTESSSKDWWTRNDAFDEAIRRRFGAAYREAVRGRLDHWKDAGRGCLALCILLDQVPRNMFRGSAEAFATDALARDIARHALDKGFDRDVELTDHQRQFLYMPFQHSEDLEDQRLCVRLAKTRTADGSFVEFCQQHLRIIERFSRFPHRNAILRRKNTPQELEFLGQPGSSF